MRVENVLVANAQSLGSGWNSNPVALDHIYGLAVQSVVTGTPTGTLKLQGSCDQPGTTPANWSDIAGASQALAGAPGTYLWNVDGAHYNFVRITYAFTGGTGSLTARMNCKGA